MKRKFLLLILLSTLSGAHADTYQGYGVGIGDIFEYYFTFEHVHTGWEVQNFSRFDLRELDPTLNASVELNNETSFRVKIGEYLGSQFTKPDRIPSSIITEENETAINDVPQFLIHDTNWETYMGRLELVLNHSLFDDSHTFTIISSETEVGYISEWTSEYSVVNNSISQVFERKTGMADYYIHHTIDPHDTYISYTDVTIFRTGANQQTEFKIFAMTWYYIGILFVLSRFGKGIKRHQATIK